MSIRCLVGVLFLLAALGCGSPAPPPGPGGGSPLAGSPPPSSPSPASPAQSPMATGAAASPEVRASPAQSGDGASPGGGAMSAGAASPVSSESPAPGSSSSRAPVRASSPSPQTTGSFERTTEADGSTTLRVRGSGSALPAPAASPSVTYRAAAQVDLRRFDVPFYPGAHLQGGATGSPQAADGRSVAMASAVLDTTDSFEKVVGFYESRMKGAGRMETSAGPVRTTTLTTGGAPGVVAHGSTEVVVQQSGSQPGTRITITTYREP